MSWSWSRSWSWSWFRSCPGPSPVLSWSWSWSWSWSCPGPGTHPSAWLGRGVAEQLSSCCGSPQSGRPGTRPSTPFPPPRAPSLASPPCHMAHGAARLLWDGTHPHFCLCLKRHGWYSGSSLISHAAGSEVSRSCRQSTILPVYHSKSTKNCRFTINQKLIRAIYDRGRNLSDS